MLLNELSKKEKESYICFNNVPRYNNKIIIDVIYVYALSVLSKYGKWACVLSVIYVSHTHNS